MTASETEDRVSDEQQVATAETDEQTEPATEVPADTTRRRRLSWIALLVASVLIMASGLFAWWQAAGDDEVDRAETRDAVLIAGKQHITTMQTLDYRDVEKGLKAWNAATTGSLNDSIKAIDSEEQGFLVDQKKVSVGKVVDAAVLDLDKNTATVVAAVEVTVSDDPSAGTEPTVKRNRYSADLVLVRGVWKLENIGPVPVDVS